MMHVLYFRDPALRGHIRALTVLKIYMGRRGAILCS